MIVLTFYCLNNLFQCDFEFFQGTVSFRFKEVPFFFLKSKLFDLRKISCSKSKNGNQKKCLMQVNLRVENFLKSKIYCTETKKSESQKHYKFLVFGLKFSKLFLSSFSLASWKNSKLHQNYFFLTVGWNNFGNKIPIMIMYFPSKE